MGYSQPDKSSKFVPSEHPEWLNQLLLIWPTSVETVNFTRKDGTPDPTDIVTADVAIITLMDQETGKPVFLKDARIGGQALTPQIKKRVGDKVLGRLAQSPRQAEKSGAFYLLDWTLQDAQLAEHYEAQFPHNPNAPAQPSGAAPQTAWQDNGAAQQQWQQSAPPTAPPAQAQQWQAPPQQQSWQQNGGQQTAPPVQDTKDPALVKWLVDHGENPASVATMDDATARRLAATYP